MPEVSIIIPVYNASAFLERCLSSLQSQTFSAWTARCVDDGSTDDSGKMLDRFASEDSRIQVIHKQNSGVSAARNTALAKVESEFLTFVDSDDFLHPQALEVALNAIRKDSSDLVAYTYDRSYRTWMVMRHVLGIPEPKKLKFKDFGEVESKCSSHLLEEWATEYSHPEEGQDGRWIVKHCQPWRCLYRSSKVKDITFQEGVIYEDFAWWGEVLLNIDKATILNLPLYFYYPNRRSYIFSSSQDFRIESLKKALASAEKVFKSANPSQKEAWERKFMVPFRAKLAAKEKRAGKQ